MNDRAETLSPREVSELLKDAASIAGAAKIIEDGYRYVDTASFWQWIHDHHARIFSEGLQHWMSLHPKSAEVLIRAKGVEWDVFRTYHPHLVDINTLSASVTDRVKDLSSLNPLTGHGIPIQVKAPLSDSGINQAVDQLFNHYPPDTKFAVTQSVYDRAVQHGMSPDRFVKVLPDAQVKAAGAERYQQALSGQADPSGITLGGTLTQAGKGALIGTVIYLGASAIANYSRYQSGEIDHGEYARLLLKDGVKGAGIFGPTAVINVGVQYAAAAAGIAAPLTIPVMLVLSFTLRRIVDPMFGDGQYAEVLAGMKYHRSFEDGWKHFGELSVALYDTELAVLEEMRMRALRGTALNAISAAQDRELEEALREDR